MANSIILNEGLTYDDVLLIPQYSNILPQKTDLKTKNPYNTYTNFGLPRGPISNPGRASLIAVLNPSTFAIPPAEKNRIMELENEVISDCCYLGVF